MAPKSLFGRDDEEDPKGDETRASGAASPAQEGVRLIEPDKAAEVAEKGTTAKRRGGDVPKYGDRPAAPPADKRAAIRLPLAGSADLGSIERPKPAPVNRPRAEGSAGGPPTQVSIGAPTVGTGEVSAVAAPDTSASPPADDRPRRKRKKERKALADDSAALFDEPAELEPIETRETSAGRDELTDTGSQVVLSVEPPTGEVSLPHWTEPATGEVPKVVIGDMSEEDDEQAAWDSFTGGGARYRDQHDTWDDASVTDLLDDERDRLGALAAVDDDLQTQDEFLTFDDLDMPAAEMPRPPTRGSVHDPVRQGKAGRTTGSTPVVRPPSKKSPRRPPGGADRSQPGRSPGGPTRRPSRDGKTDTGDNKTVSEKLGVAAPGGSDAGGGRNIKMAVAIGLPMGLIAWLVFAKAPAVVCVGLITIVVFLAGAEFLAAVGTRRFKPVLPVAWAALIALPIAAYYGGEVAIPLVLFLTVLFSFLWYIMGLAHEKPLGNLGVTFFAIIWVGMFGSFASLIYRIGPVRVGDTYTDVNQGPTILIMAIVVSVASDAGALLWGKLYGKRTFTPISPHKTVEGLIGGVVTAVVITTIASVKFGPFGVGGTAFFALCCAVASPIGDLAESLIKRDIGLKDMSELIPGHGGVLDRFDALLFVLPVAYFVTRLLLPGIPYF